MYNEIELYDESLFDLELEEQIKYSEMSIFDRKFLCGFLKEKRPHKILELGVSSGATTATILNCLDILGISGEMYSVDISEMWYRDNNKETGFVVKYMKINSNICHKFMLGKPIPYVVDEIGKDIDFLILDTTHDMPGEVLDFLVCLPYLKDGAVVVLHDIMYNMLVEHAISCKSLFIAVKAKKWYMGLENIAAFEVSDETRKNIADIVMSLSLTWRYLIPRNDLVEYNRIIEKNYSQEIVDWIKEIENMQMLHNVEEKVRKHTKLEEDILKSLWRHQENVILYGGGYWGKIYLSYAKANNLPVSCFVISDGEKKASNSIEEIPVYWFSELPIKPNCGLIIRALDERKWKEITYGLIKNGWYKIV